MSAEDALESIDWAAQWFAPLRAMAMPVLRNIGRGGVTSDALNGTARTPAALKFVPQNRLPPGQAYERFIFETGRVPTRDNLHDLFNGLMWLRLPRSKVRLNALQAAEIARHGVGATRGPVRDAATVFDENGVLLHAPDALWRALVQRRWPDVFGALRPLWRRASVLVFGHAALEKLVAPYKGITGHVWRVAPAFDAAGDLDALDRWLAADLTPQKLAAKPFAALPILGVPGWWPGNAEPAFYDDARVFRPARLRVPGAPRTHR